MLAQIKVSILKDYGLNFVTVNKHLFLFSFLLYQILHIETETNNTLKIVSGR